ncbi:MAG TPA: hypothetical protein VD886_03540 [Herpetosiphonaceae bacterium]|nr:hypothetical protein [Herpetosiphonaceae bacterium]
MKVDLLAAAILLAAVAANAWLARRMGRTANARWLGFALYSLALAVLVGVLLLAALGAERLLGLGLEGAPPRVAAAAGGFWLLAVLLVGRRLRRYE